jgi:PHD/YefM family antitoxin component YafN of YafNO toxin-antitoxin module
MLEINQDIRPHSSLKGNTVQRIRQLKEAGEPIVITVCGTEELVVQDAASYQLLLELIDRLETLQGIQAGLEDMAAGRTVSLSQVREELLRENGVPR